MEITEVLLGGLLGIIGTLSGVSITYWLTKQREKKKAEEEFRDTVTVIYHEIKNNIPKLDVSQAPGMLETSGEELLKTRGFYSQMPTDVLSDILQIYALVKMINDSIGVMRQASYAVVAAHVEPPTGIPELRKEIDDLRKHCLDKIKQTLPQIKEMLGQ